MKRSMQFLFLTTELFLYSAFLLLDLFSNTDTKWLKFAAILLIALMSFLSDDKTITAALCFTAAADIFLLLLDQNYGVGIFLFILVQLLYSRSMNAKKILRFQILIALFSAFLFIVSRKTECLACGYITVFLMNLIHACFLYSRNKSKQGFLFLLGLAMFFCCDLCVGYYNIGTGALWNFSRIAMWGFYLPGQVFILLSAISKQGDKS